MDSFGAANRSRWIPIVRLGWPLVLLVILAVAFAGDGFNPTDEGLIAATAERILQGQVPHVDFITPRPAISAYLHLPETLLPTPLFLTGRIVALAEVIALSVLLAWLVLDRSPLRWGLGLSLGVAASILVNLNTVPLMPWYTTDALLLAAIGLVALRQGLRSGNLVVIALSFGALTLSAMAKQSFAPVLVIGIVWLVVGSARDTRMVRGAVAVGSAAVPAVIYSSVVVLAGGWSSMLRQLFSARPVIGEELLLAPLASPVSAFLLLALPAALAWFHRGSPHTVPSSTGRWNLVAAVALATLVLTILVTSGLRVTAYWSILLTWLLAAYVVSAALLARWLDGTALILVLLAWMTSLSYGVPVPSLVAGSVALTLFDRMWRRGSAPALSRPMVPAPVAFAVLFAVALPTFLLARVEYVHRDAPRSELTEDLGRLSPELAGIRTNVRTATYLRTMRDCVAAHPAASVTVLPDNPAVYPVFGWNNALPLDFLYPPEYEGSREEVVAATADLTERGDFLVLFERVRADSLLDHAIDLTGSGSAHTYDAALTEQMRDILAMHADFVDCGAFEGYDAPSVSEATAP